MQATIFVNEAVMTNIITSLKPTSLTSQLYLKFEVSGEVSAILSTSGLSSLAASRAGNNSSVYSSAGRKIKSEDRSSLSSFS